jgi:hypothetical protein
MSFRYLATAYAMLLAFGYTTYIHSFGADLDGLILVLIAATLLWRPDPDAEKPAWPRNWTDRIELERRGAAVHEAAE